MADSQGAYLILDASLALTDAQAARLVLDPVGLCRELRPMDREPIDPQLQDLFAALGRYVLAAHREAPLYGEGA